MYVQFTHFSVYFYVKPKFYFNIGYIVKKVEMSSSWK